VLGVAVGWTPSAAAGSLALQRSDYPYGSRIAAIPATNAAADQYLAPVHHSSFEHLHRLDGSGWLQFGTSAFRTGSGTSAQTHQTIYGYGVNVFRTQKAAGHALKDVKIPTTRVRVAHLSARRFTSTDANETLVFVFFRVRTAEVEAYYQYAGVAPASIAASLHHYFGRQLSHLAHLVRLYTSRPPPPTATPVPPTATATDTPVPTDTPAPTSTSVPTATPTAIPTETRASTATPLPTSTATPTPTPINYAVTASMARQTYNVGEQATVNAAVTLNGRPAAGVKVFASFGFSTGGAGCQAVTDATGNASCSVVVPSGNSGQIVLVNVEAVAGGGYTAQTTTSFRVGS